MKSLTQYITEKLVLNSNSKIRKREHNYHPKTTAELKELIKELIEERGPNANLNDIDTSEIVAMHDLFQFQNIKNIDISEWDVSNVISMNRMFFNNNKFDCDLSNWDVSKVIEMDSMFMNCDNFKGKGLKNWNTKKVRTMDYMFCACNKFEEDISDWDVSSCKGFKHMFADVVCFNQPIGKWDVSAATDFSCMLNGCEEFDQDLSNWKFNEDIEKMVAMFKNCKKFRGKGLQNWNLPNILDCTRMFEGCKNLELEYVKNMKLHHNTVKYEMFRNSSIDKKQLGLL